MPLLPSACYAIVETWVRPFIDPTAMPNWWALIRVKTADHDCHWRGDMALRMRKPYRGSWYVCFSAMNCEPAVYMSKIFFSEVTDSSEEQIRVLPKGSVWSCFVSRLFSELVWWLVMDILCADWDYTRAREDTEGVWVLLGCIIPWRRHVLIPHSPMPFFTLEAQKF